MNDAERDAWLREALRHAPDSDALPPSGVSEAILLKARAAARATPPARRHGDSATAPGDSRRAFARAFAAFWGWLARPPVAAAFASVMAATLVGLMWWDRPMDETMPRSPAVASERSDAVPPRAPAAAAPAAPKPAQSEDTLKKTAPARSEAPPNPAADDGEVARRPGHAPEPSAATDAKLAEPATAVAKRRLDRLAKERALPVEQKNEAPSPFPSMEAQRASPATNARNPIDTPTSPLASGRLAGDESRPAATMQSDKAIARSGAGAVTTPIPLPVPAPAPAPPMAPATPLRESAATPAREPPSAQARDSAAAVDTERAQRQRPLGDLREKDAAGFASPAATVARSPLTSLLATIAADPGRWSRQTAPGASIALDRGWRAWLAELDAAAGPWRRFGGAGAAVDVDADADAPRSGATTLRLVDGGRVVATVRLEGATVRVDESSGTGSDRWQATVSPASADRLRAAAQRLPP